MSGSNNYNNPWKIENVPPSLKCYFNEQVFSKFCSEAAALSKWSKLSKILCIFLETINLSPGYLFLHRIMRVNRSRAFIKLMNSQAVFQGQGIFLPNRNMALKWTLTSDKSKIFLDVVTRDEDSWNVLNWELAFPQKFIICRLNFISRSGCLQSAFQTGDPRPLPGEDNRPFKGHNRQPPKIQRTFRLSRISPQKL